MKYLIQDSEDHTLGEIMDYFKKELLMTNLVRDDIVIEDSLKTKVAMVELERIFDENGMAEFYETYKNGIQLKHSGNFIEFSREEIQSRFDDAYQCVLSGLEEYKDYSISVTRAEKYARMQHFLGTKGKGFIPFEEWRVS